MENHYFEVVVSKTQTHKETVNERSLREAILFSVLLFVQQNKIKIKRRREKSSSSTATGRLGLKEAPSEQENQSGGRGK